MGLFLNNRPQISIYFLFFCAGSDQFPLMRAAASTKRRLMSPLRFGRCATVLATSTTAAAHSQRLQHLQLQHCCPRGDNSVRSRRPLLFIIIIIIIHSRRQQHRRQRRRQRRRRCFGARLPVALAAATRDSSDAPFTRCDSSAHLTRTASARWAPPQCCRKSRSRSSRSRGADRRQSLLNFEN